MTAQDTQKALVGIPPMASIPGNELIVRIAREAGLSPFRQFREMVGLRLGETKLKLAEYYGVGVYNAALSAAEKRTYVGTRANFRLNSRLSPRHTCKMTPFINSKVFYGATLTQLGMRTTHTQALALRSGGAGNMNVLRSVADIVRFLREEADYPVFGKPQEGTWSIGAALLAGYDRREDTVLLGNGNAYDVTALATEMWDDYPQGYIFQTAIKQHEALTAMAGPAIGSLRIVTTSDGTGAKVLYTAWKMPSPKAMSDNFWQAGSMLSAIDRETGEVIQTVQGGGPDRRIIETHPVSGMTCKGFRIPMWDEALRLACDAHDLVPENGIFGFDMAMTPEGPMIIECNPNPAHSVYQTAFGRGMLNTDHMAVLQPIIDEKAKNSPKAQHKKRLAERKLARKEGRQPRTLNLID